MGLNISISLDKDIREIDQFFTDLKFRAVTKSARQGLNRAAKRTRSLALKEIRKRRNIKLKDAKGFVTTKRAEGRDLFQLEARVNFSGIPLPLIFFILGQKSPTVQTLPNSRRKPRRFEINKGQKQPKAGLFIQKAKRGKLQYQVFRREDPSDKSKGFKAQSAPSIAEMLRKKRGLMLAIKVGALNLMRTEYDRALQFNMAQIKL